MDRIVLGDDTESWQIARRLVRARLDARALPDYPGTIPRSLEAGYSSQDAAIQLWQAPVAGWKVGKIADDIADLLGEDRLLGPIFADRLQWQGEAPAQFPVIAGGFAAVEAEYVFEIDHDAPADHYYWTPEDAAPYVRRLMVGVELAGSPLPDINRLGPSVVVSDYGNNAGLVLGPEIPDWHAQPMAELLCETFIDGVSVGTGRASSIAGGPLAALAFALGRSARRGMPLRQGQLVSTGAATGIHDIVAGQRARVEFAGIAALDVVAVVAQPQSVQA